MFLNGKIHACAPWRKHVQKDANWGVGTIGRATEQEEKGISETQSGGRREEEGQ